jgi:protein SCO1
MKTTREAPTLPVALLLCWVVITMLLWAMAFYRAPDATPEWLLRAQAVCFGTNETGLPDTYGWMVLALGPLSFLAGFLVALGREVRQGLSAMVATAGGKVLVVLILATLLGEGVWLQGQIENGITVANTVYDFDIPEQLPPDYPRLQMAAQPFSLTNQAGEQISPAALRGKVVLLTFAFAHCQTVCPAILHNVLQAADRFPQEEIAVLVVTLDPWRDTPSRLPTLASHWGLGDNAHVLSGPVDDVLAVLDDYNVPRERDQKTGDISHPALVYVLDTTGSIAYAFNNPAVDWLSAATVRLLESDVLAVDSSR